MQSDPHGSTGTEPKTSIEVGLGVLMRVAQQAGLPGLQHDEEDLYGNDPVTGIRSLLPDVAAIARLAGIAWA
jgi:hypothetical protein